MKADKAILAGWNLHGNGETSIRKEETPHKIRS
jgi:hypothetical protein